MYGDSIWDIIKVIVLAILIVAIGISLLTVAFSPIMKLSCEESTKDIGLPHRWSFWGGCQVQENGNWIPLSNWTYFRNK